MIGMNLRQTKGIQSTDRFYQENKERVFGYLVRLTGDFHLSSDLMQETFFRYFSRYKKVGENLALLFTIARNAALDSIRKRREETDLGEEILSSGRNPELQVIEKQEINRMNAAIQKLSPGDREMIALVSARTFSYKEIGEMLNISEANVKVKIHRARLRLREILGNGGI